MIRKTDKLEGSQTLKMNFLKHMWVSGLGKKQKELTKREDKQKRTEKRNPTLNKYKINNTRKQKTNKQKTRPTHTQRKRKPLQWVL